ncbi:PREDICTED: glyceraldehyde-3-phosphate dehydrogenase-like [Condylura cristata]|uniref:glyceraldehyde-3-phosphate dehydrogenase-like n=1 Tax=Condylura cristata TaxID=143302 RepID=UPI000334326B|nr:PREDICTED: glyceraldehyde-3-phosphate dehydrogenase-like [Condylura cristata]
MTFHVPTHNLSVVDLIYQWEKTAKYNDIKKVVMQAPQDPLKVILRYIEDQVVSCYFLVIFIRLFNSDIYSSTFLVRANIAFNGHFVKLISWYDNKFGYSNLVVDFMVHMTSKE